MRGSISKRKGGVLSIVVVMLVFTVVIGAMAATGKIQMSGVSSITTGTDSKTTSEGSDSSGDINSVAEESDNEEPAENNIVKLSAVPAQTSKYTSITDVMTDESGNVYAADATGKKLYKLNSSGTVLATYSASSQVNGVYVNGSTVYLLEGELAGLVTVLDSANLTKKAEIEVGHTPISMVVNGTTGYVANRYSNDVYVIDLNTNAVSSIIEID